MIRQEPRFLPDHFMTQEIRGVLFAVTFVIFISNIRHFQKSYAFVMI